MIPPGEIDAILLVVTPGLAGGMGVALRVVTPGLAGEMDVALRVVTPRLAGERDAILLVVTPGLKVNFGSATMFESSSPLVEASAALDLVLLQGLNRVSIPYSITYKA